MSKNDIGRNVRFTWDSTNDPGVLDTEVYSGTATVVDWYEYQYNVKIDLHQGDYLSNGHLNYYILSPDEFEFID